MNSIFPHIPDAGMETERIPLSPDVFSIFIIFGVVRDLMIKSEKPGTFPMLGKNVDRFFYSWFSVTH
jgi:hypothetical protein